MAYTHTVDYIDGRNKINEENESDSLIPERETSPDWSPSLCSQTGCFYRERFACSGIASGPFPCDTQKECITASFLSFQVKR